VIAKQSEGTLRLQYLGGGKYVAHHFGRRRMSGIWDMDMGNVNAENSAIDYASMGNCLSNRSSELFRSFQGLLKYKIMVAVKVRCERGGDGRMEQLHDSKQQQSGWLGYQNKKNLGAHLP
jgi:hypothetical protein